MEAVGNENEYIAYVENPAQTGEQITISIAMMKEYYGSSLQLVDYSEITNIKICPTPDIIVSSLNSYPELYSTAALGFKLNYICEFSTMKVQYKMSDDGDYEDAISVSSLDNYNIFSVTVKLPKTRIYFKFIDKFNNSKTINYYLDPTIFTYVEYDCAIQDQKEEYHGGDEVNIKCTAKSPRLAYSIHEFYFLDYSTYDQYRLMASSSETSVEFSVTLPEPKSSYPVSLITICQSIKSDPSISIYSFIPIKIIPNFKFDFDIISMDQSSLNILVKLYFNYQMKYSVNYVISNSKVYENSTFTTLQENVFGTPHTFSIPHSLESDYYFVGILLIFENSKQCFATKEINYIDDKVSLSRVGHHTITAGIYEVKKGFTVLLQPPIKKTKTVVYAKIGEDKYTLLKNNVIGITFNETGSIYLDGKASIQTIVMSITNIKTDEIMFLLGRSELRIGNMENVQFNMNSSKNYLFVLSSFDGKGKSRMDGDVNTESLEIENYYADGTLVVNEESSRKLLAASSKPDNINIYSMQIHNDEYKFSYKFKTMRSRDKTTVIIHSKLGTHYLATKPDSYTGDEEPTPTPVPVSDDSQKGGASPAKIAGGIVGVIVVIAIVCVVVFFVWRKKKQAKYNDSEEGDIHSDSSYSNKSA